VSKKTLQVLIAVVVGLVLALLVLDSTDRNDVDLEAGPLLPGFKSRANEVDQVRISRPAGEESVTIRREGDAWVVSARDDYPADVGKLRQLIIALADASIVEEKTSNPEQYEKLGVDDPAEGGDGPKVFAGGEGFSYEVILGDSAQRDFRYARIPDQPTSYLIDQNPDVPASVGDWLHPDIIDIGSERVRKVSISHANGDDIVIEKSDKELTDFTVLDVPEDRELSYATVGNGIAGALSQLKLEDVRARRDASADATIVFETWDGLEITAAVTSDEGASWVAFAVGTVPPAPAGGPAGDDTSEVEEPPVEPTPDDAAAASNRAAVDREANELNERLSAWHFQLPDFKKNLLVRRWDDILKAADAE